MKDDYNDMQINNNEEGDDTNKRDYSKLLKGLIGFLIAASFGTIEGLITTEKCNKIQLPLIKHDYNTTNCVLPFSSVTSFNNATTTLQGAEHNNIAMSGTQILAMLGLLVVLGVTLKVFCGPSKCSNNSYSLCPRGKKKDDEESSTQLKDSKDFSHN